ncbi:MAG: hypothetical protein HQK77_13300 [Desulfobacterales bacterium]|nr:hypothetical protein [Desulfobacterales bacterium]
MKDIKTAFKGVALLFDHEEIKTLFKHYLSLIGIIEVFVFFVSFIHQLGPENVPFPWKTYAFASFIIPIAMTFLLCIFIMAFNKYLFSESDISIATIDNETDIKDMPFQKLTFFFNVINRMPFMLLLFLIGISALIVYKLDVIFFFIARAGEKTLLYLLMGGGVVVVVISFFVFFWLFLNYRLRKQNMEYKFRYQQEAMKELGLFLVNDHTMIDQKGNVIRYDSPEPVNQIENQTYLLPNIFQKNG